MTEPLRISVEIARHLFHDDCRTDKLSAAEAIDDFIRPVVELLEESRGYVAEMKYAIPASSLLARIDAALKDAGGT
jgi:hypothetical protein